MSEQDRFDWNEDVDFDSETDVQEGFDDFEDPIDGFADFDDMSDYDESLADEGLDVDDDAVRDGAESETVAITSEGEAGESSNEKKVPAAIKRTRRRGISAKGLGFLFTASIVVAGIGMGGAVLLAEGVNPRSLWQPQNLLQIDQLLNFADHPLNILYMVTMGIVFLALLGSYQMSKAAAEANKRTRDAEDILDRLTALSLDKQEEWKSQEFKEFPPAEAFVARALGAWRLQQARQKRLMGVEGELHRLEKALSTNSRSDLTGRFDHPAVGRLTDEMVRYFDAREAAVRKLEEYQQRDGEKSGEILDLLQKSRQWNGSTLDQMGVNCVALDEMTGQLDNLSKYLEKMADESTSTEGMTDIIEGIRRDLAGQSFAGKGSEQTVSELNDLVDRGSKLAFRIAMEVARLGPRGERLLPMSQSLEDLTTGFRQLADRANDRGQGTAPAAALKSVHKKLETLAALITQDDKVSWSDMVDEIHDFGPATARISSRFTRMMDGFNEQEDRLVQVGNSFAEMAEVEFDSSAITPTEPPAETGPALDVAGPGSSADPEPAGNETVVVSPFAAAGSSILQSDNESTMPGLDLEGPDRFNMDVEPAADMPLSDDEEKVYDLEDLGASPAAELETESATDTGEVFDLSSFDATPLDGEGSQDQGEVEEEVFELSDFEASPVDSETSEPAEEVYDLAAFGACALDPAPGADEAAPAVEDGVFDLADFGAKPIK